MQNLLKIRGIRVILIITIWLYILGFLPDVNREIQNLVSNPIVAILALIGVIQLSYHDLYLAVLLGIALILSIHMNQFFDMGMGRTKLYGQEDWNDSTMFETGPMGYNVDKFCGNNWSFQCKGVNTFGTQFNTQGMDDVQGHAVGESYSAADF